MATQSNTISNRNSLAGQLLCTAKFHPCDIPLSSVQIKVRECMTNHALCSSTMLAACPAAMRVLKAFTSPSILSSWALMFIIVTTASSVQSSRSDISDISATPHGLQHRDTSTTLASSLLAVLEANASNSSSSSAREIDAASTYENTINSNVAGLDDLYGQSAVGGISTSVRASLACQAALLVFGSETITPKSLNYTTEEQEPWFVFPCICVCKWLCSEA